MKKMQIPIIMAAFGTTSQAEATYRIIDTRVKEAFSGHDVHWAFSSRMIKSRKGNKNSGGIYNPKEILDHLHAKGHRWAIVQSVHLTCGHEFYRLIEEIGSLKIRTSVGMPLLTTPDDHINTAECLGPIIKTHPGKAILLIGHGTDHPSWTTYPAFQQGLRQMYGNRIFVGTVEQFPPSDWLIPQIVEAGFHEVLLIPFLLVAGMHYRNDLMGKSPDSWRSKLLAAGLSVEAIGDGIGSLTGIGDIFCRHIGEAMGVIPDEVVRD